MTAAMRCGPATASILASWWNFRKAVKRAGLGSDVTPHALRHTAASIMVKSVPLIHASKMLGHSNTKITEAVYVHLLADDLRSAADATAALLPAPTTPPAPTLPAPRGRLARLAALLRRRRRD